ncbi:MAG: hypothetical protein VB137_11035 [Burkholderia sp.]
MLKKVAVQEVAQAPPAPPNSSAGPSPGANALLSCACWAANRLTRRLAKLASRSPSSNNGANSPWQASQPV